MYKNIYIKSKAFSKLCSPQTFILHRGEWISKNHNLVKAFRGEWTN